MSNNIVFVAVSRENVILATYIPQSGLDLEKDVQKIVNQSLKNNEQRRMNYYIFTIYKSNPMNLTFICASSNEKFEDPQFPFKYLEQLSTRWNFTYGDKASSISTAGPHSLTKSSQNLFQTVLKEVSNISKTEKMKHDLDQTQRFMEDSVKAEIARDEQLNKLTNKSESLMATSESFKAQSQNLKNKMRCSYYRSLFLKIFIALIILYVILIYVCGGMTLKPRCL